MTGEARALLLRLPREWRRSINRASLPLLGLQQTGFAVSITQDHWNQDSFDVGKDIAPEASMAMRYQDEVSFGPPHLWEPWAKFRQTRGVTWKANEYGDASYEGGGRVEFLFTREPIMFREGFPSLHQRLAAFIVKRWGLL